jgi:hypothetical protein
MSQHMMEPNKTKLIVVIHTCQSPCGEIKYITQQYIDATDQAFGFLNCSLSLTHNTLAYTRVRMHTSYACKCMHEHTLVRRSRCK